MPHQNNYMTRTKNSKDHWETPPYFFDLLQKKLKLRFTIDVAAGMGNTLCERFCSSVRNGLLQDWKGETAFCNPPFSDLKKWVKKCYVESRKDNTIIVMLCPSRTDTKYWHDYIMKAEGLMFCVGRVNFLINGEEPFRIKNGKKVKTGANFPLAIVLFGKDLRRDLRGIRSFHHKEYKKKYEKNHIPKFTRGEIREFNYDSLWYDESGDVLDI